MRPGLFVNGRLERIEPVRRGRARGGDEVPGFMQLVVMTVPGYRMRATFNEYDRESGDLSPVWQVLQGVEAVGQQIVVKVAAEVRQFRAEEMLRAVDEIRGGAGIEALRGMVGKFINYRALSIVYLEGAPGHVRESA